MQYLKSILYTIQLFYCSEVSTMTVRPIALSLFIYKQITEWSVRLEIIIS